MAEPMYKQVPASRTTFERASVPEDVRDDRDEGRTPEMEPDDSGVELDDDEPRHEVEASSTRSGLRSRTSGVALRDRDGDVPAPGALVAGKYRIERIVEETHSLVVTQALDVGLEQRVMLKYLRSSASSRGDAVTRFLRAARTASQLQSEHAARILDLGRLRSGAPFVVTEELSGWELDEVLRVRGPLPVQEAVEYVIQVADAVAEGHSLGIVHGSLNLTNIVLTRRSDDSPLIKVLGFGTAPRHDQSALRGDLATSGFMTVLPYLAPEQIRSADDIDDRADVWALGALLHTLLSGAPPFRGKTALALLAVVSADVPRPLAETRDDVSPELDAAVVRCLEKDRAARFANVGELVQALKSFASGDAQRSVERISRMVGRPTRPPPLPGPTGRSIVPVARPKATPAATPAAPPLSPSTASRWMLIAAMVGAGAGALGALAVVSSARPLLASAPGAFVLTEPDPRVTPGAATPVPPVPVSQATGAAPVAVAPIAAAPAAVQAVPATALPASMTPTPGAIAPSPAPALPVVAAQTRPPAITAPPSAPTIPVVASPVAAAPMAAKASPLAPQAPQKPQAPTAAPIAKRTVVSKGHAASAAAAPDLFDDTK